MALRRADIINDRILAVVHSPPLYGFSTGIQVVHDVVVVVSGQSLFQRFLLRFFGPLFNTRLPGGYINDH